MKSICFAAIAFAAISLTSDVRADIAQPMYLSAYASMITHNAQSAIKPLNHLVEFDPAFADVQNALALALFTALPNEHAWAFQHATEAITIAPNVPQFVVTHVLTDNAQWSVAGDGTARIKRDAARRLLAARSELLRMSGNAKRLGKLLESIEESTGNHTYPLIFADYAKLIKNPALAITRPADDEFDVAQRAIEERICELKQKLGDNE
jgi:hypothetical protein